MTENKGRGKENCGNYSVAVTPHVGDFKTSVTSKFEEQDDKMENFGRELESILKEAIDILELKYPWEQVLILC